MHGRDSLTASQDKLRTVPSGPTATPVTSRVTASPQLPGRRVRVQGRAGQPRAGCVRVTSPSGATLPADGSSPREAVEDGGGSPSRSADAQTVADRDGPRLEHLAVPAEGRSDSELGFPAAAVGRDQAERLQVDSTGSGVARGGRAALHRATAPQYRAADPQERATPRVLEVRRPAGELDQHPEAPGID